MKKIRIALLAATALCSTPVVALAQPADDQGSQDGADQGSADNGDQGGDEGDKGDADKGDKDEEPGLGSICEIDPDACPKLDFQQEATRNNHEQVYAVQQVYVLRRGRFEFQPYWGFTLNDQFVSHPGPGLALNYWITNVLAIGVNGNLYRPFNSDSEFNFQTRRAARIGVPLTEYSWSAALNFTYAPILGKFRGPADLLLQYDGYLLGGVGAISTRPIPVIDPDNRDFSFKNSLSFNLGGGVHLFFNRWLAVILEGRGYVFNDHLENTELAPTLAEQQNSSTWYGEHRLTVNVQAQVGLSIFLPFSFDYRLPK
jgi:outer membrane beta-barrel protein